MVIKSLGRISNLKIKMNYRIEGQIQVRAKVLRVQKLNESFHSYLRYWEY